MKNVTDNFGKNLTVLYEYYRNKKESKIKTDIKHEKNPFKKKELEDIYNQIKRYGEFKK